VVTPSSYCSLRGTAYPVSPSNPLAMRERIADIKATYILRVIGE
jgi:hypothetical protein